MAIQEVLRLINHRLPRGEQFVKVFQGRLGDLVVVSQTPDKVRHSYVVREDEQGRLDLFPNNHPNPPPPGFGQ